MKKAFLIGISGLDEIYSAILHLLGAHEVCGSLRYLDNAVVWWIY